MFSAIFGNIFYGRVEEDIPTTTDTDTAPSTEASTQTFDNKSLTQVNLDTSRQQNSPNTSTSNLNDTSSSQQLDWVLVEGAETPNTNDKACGDGGINNVEMCEEEEKDAVVGQNPSPSLPSMENDDILIGSFFRKNELEEEVEDSTDNKNVICIEKLVRNDTTWLITPLPCLTSITASVQQQKSMIDNDQIENLRIEQPDRFMSASTTTVTDATVVKPLSRRLSMKGKPTLRYKKTYAEATQQEDVVELKSLFESPVPMSMELVLVPTVITTTTATTPTRNDKRKETEKSIISSPASSSSSLESPKKMSRKTGKSMKTNKGSMKSNSSSHQKPKANKENMQMKTLLLAECFPNENKKKRNSGRYGQILHANKNSALFAMAGNTRTRKFHNLQQPSITVPHPVKF